jgi:AcrR family transcriptional regulator
MTQPRRRDKTAKIATILQTAKTLFKKQGYASTTTNQIAAEAGVSIGLLYKYFPDGKPDIARKSVEEIREVVLSEELAEAAPENAPDVLRRSLIRFIKGHRQISSNVAAFEMAVLEDAETAELGKHLFNVGSDSVTSILSKLTGRADSERLQKWGSIIFHIVDSVTHRQVLHEGLIVSDEELADALTRIIIGSLPAIIEE